MGTKVKTGTKAKHKSKWAQTQNWRNGCNRLIIWKTNSTQTQRNLGKRLLMKKMIKRGSKGTRRRQSQKTTEKCHQRNWQSTEPLKKRLCSAWTLNIRMTKSKFLRTQELLAARRPL